MGDEDSTNHLTVTEAHASVVREIKNLEAQLPRLQARLFHLQGYLQCLHDFCLDKKEPSNGD